MDLKTEEFLELHEHPLLRRVRRAYGVVPLALPLGVIENKAKADGVTVEEAISKVLADEGDPESREWLRTIAESAANNSTCFFRNPAVFQHFRTVTLPALIAANKDSKKLRLWCAGCSTGEEAYTLATILLDEPALKDWDLKVIATDISHSALDEARAGKYTFGVREAMLQGDVGTPEWRDAYFNHTSPYIWEVKPAVREIVDIREHNVLDSFDPIGPVDTIFCRHVLMHFTGDAAIKTVNAMAQLLPAHGRLYMGRAEAQLMTNEDRVAFDDVDPEQQVCCFKPRPLPLRPPGNDIPGAGLKPPLDDNQP